MGRVAMLVLACTACMPVHQPKEPRHRCPTRDPGSVRELGTVPDADSALRPTELHVDGRLAGVLSGSAADTTTWAFATDGHVRVNVDNVTAMLGTSLGTLRLQNVPDPAWNGSYGNIRAGLGYRWFHWGEYGEPAGTEHTYRRALALRVTGDFDQRTRGTDGANQRGLGTVFVMDSSRNAPGHHVTAVGEARYEMVGCYAPFVHAQVGVGTSFGDVAVVQDGRTTTENTMRTTLVLPASLAVGTHREVTTADSGAWTITLYGEFAVLAGRLPVFVSPVHAVTPNTDFDVQSRIRFGAEIARAVRIGGTIDIQLGPVEGVFASASIDLPFEVKR